MGDLKTALIGEYSDGVAMSVLPASLSSVSIPEHGVASTEFVSTAGDQCTVYHCPSNRTSVGPGPLIRDPYEMTVCQVRVSNVMGGGEGLWSVKDLKKGEIVAFYNGVRLPYVPGEKENWDTSGYKIFVNADHSSGERIDLPGYQK